MADLQHYEFVVSQKIEGKWRLRRILAVVGYVLFVLVFFTLGVVSKLGFPLIALTPLFLWIIIFFTWRYTRPDYEITTVSNSLRFAIVYGNRTRKPQVEVEFRKMQKIAPYDGDGQIDVKRFAPEKVYTAVSSMTSGRDIYFAIWEEDKVRSVLFFEATEQLLKICKYYNSANTVITPVSR